MCVCGVCGVCVCVCVCVVCVCVCVCVVCVCGLCVWCVCVCVCVCVHVCPCTRSLCMRCSGPLHSCCTEKLPCYYMQLVVVMDTSVVPIEMRHYINLLMELFFESPITRNGGEPNSRPDKGLLFTPAISLPHFNPPFLLPPSLSLHSSLPPPSLPLPSSFLPLPSLPPPSSLLPPSSSLPPSTILPPPSPSLFLSPQSSFRMSKWYSSWLRTQWTLTADWDMTAAALSVGRLHKQPLSLSRCTM